MKKLILAALILGCGGPEEPERPPYHDGAGTCFSEPYGAPEIHDALQRFHYGSYCGRYCIWKDCHYVEFHSEAVEPCDQQTEWTLVAENDLGC